MNDNGFDATWTITHKAVFILKEIGRLSTINEIVERLKKYESPKDLSDRQLKANYSSTLGVKAKKGINFGRVLKPGSDDYLYGLKAWFLPGGSISETYLPENKKAPELTEA